MNNDQELLNEAEQDMKNSADQGGCYPRGQGWSVNGLISSGQHLTSFWRHRFHKSAVGSSVRDCYHFRLPCDVI